MASIFFSSVRPGDAQDFAAKTGQIADKHPVAQALRDKNPALCCTCIPSEHSSEIEV
jgi:hypothetical protein